MTFEDVVNVKNGGNKESPSPSNGKLNQAINTFHQASLRLFSEEPAPGDRHNLIEETLQGISRGPIGESESLERGRNESKDEIRVDQKLTPEPSEKKEEHSNEIKIPVHFAPGDLEKFFESVLKLEKEKGDLDNDSEKDQVSPTPMPPQNNRGSSLNFHGSLLREGAGEIVKIEFGGTVKIIEVNGISGKVNIIPPSESLPGFIYAEKPLLTELLNSIARFEGSSVEESRQKAEKTGAIYLAGINIVTGEKGWILAPRIEYGNKLEIGNFLAGMKHELEHWMGGSEFSAHKAQQTFLKKLGFVFENNTDKEIFDWIRTNPLYKDSLIGQLRDRFEMESGRRLEPEKEGLFTKLLDFFAKLRVRFAGGAILDAEKHT